MTNINLLPGAWKLEDLIADTERGLFLDMNRSWSIDDKRLNFQFGTEVAYEIRDGKLGQLYKDPIYTGITPEFWNSCDAIRDDDAVGAAQLRQGATLPAWPRRPRRALPASGRLWRAGAERTTRRDLCEESKNIAMQRALCLPCRPPTQTRPVFLDSDYHLTRFANNEVHQNVAETNIEVRVRVVVGARVGVSVANSLTHLTLPAGHDPERYRAGPGAAGKCRVAGAARACPANRCSRLFRGDCERQPAHPRRGGGPGDARRARGGLRGERCPAHHRP